MRAISYASLLLASTLVACGGGGGSNDSSTPPVSNDPGSSLSVPDLGAVAMAGKPSPLPAAWKNGAFMEIYVRGYKDSNGDGVGDLQGVISKLDYLKDLGVTGIWLMPVTDSGDRDHGYAVKNYRGIESDYGTMADFDQLLQEAHARGIGVIMDYVINHSSNQHPLFANASSSALNAQRDYFVWQASKPSGWSIYGSDPWYGSSQISPYGFYFAGFWSGMPDFNWKNSKVETFHHDNLRFWLNKGVDGMRFDAVGNLVENGAGAWESQPENHTIMNNVQTLLGNYSQRYMVCESPAAPWLFAASNSCGSAFAFNLQGHLLGAAKGQVTSINTLSQYFVSAPHTLATFLSNHDRFAGDRVWNQLGGNVAQYKLAAASYLLLPGTPFIYYGEEVGMANGQSLGGDWAIRTPMSWTADKSGFTSGTPFRTVSDNVATLNAETQVKVPGSLHSFYKEMLALRNRFPSIAQGTYESPFVNDKVMGYQRKLGSETTLVLINYGSGAAPTSVSGLAANAKLVQQFGGNANLDASAAGQASVNLPGQSVSVFLLQ